MMRKNKLVILAVAAVMVLTFAMPAWALFGSKFKDELEKEKGCFKLIGEMERGDYKLVSTAQLKKWMDEKKPMVIVDTMPYEASYKKNHVPGAVQFLFPIRICPSGTPRRPPARARLTLKSSWGRTRTRPS
jgi:thiosulfate/3-mercaptopyruvate sulfurtransferase